MNQFFKWVFIFAGIYNILWGLYSSINPQWLFEFAGMKPINYPEIFQVLAMVVGVYGGLYIYAGMTLKRGYPIIAIGLLGKVLGPIGFAYLVIIGAWPFKTIILILTNDLLWWSPFAIYLMKYRSEFYDEVKRWFSRLWEKG